jgi:hypothetical protein
MTQRTILVGLGSFIVAYCIGRLTVQTSQKPSAPPARIVEQRHDRTIVERSASLDLDDVRAVVREEIAQQASPAAVEREDQIHPDRLAHVKGALVESMADGRWTNDDRERLRPMLTTMSRAELEDVFSTLFPAFNTGKLRLETDGPPL